MQAFLHFVTKEQDMDSSTVVFLLGILALVAVIVVLRYGEVIKARIEAKLYGVHETEADLEAVEELQHLEGGLPVMRDKSGRNIKAHDRGGAPPRKQRVQGGRDVPANGSNRRVD